MIIYVFAVNPLGHWFLVLFGTRFHITLGGGGGIRFPGNWILNSLKGIIWFPVYPRIDSSRTLDVFTTSPSSSENVVENILETMLDMFTVCRIQYLSSTAKTKLSFNVLPNIVS